MDVLLRRHYDRVWSVCRRLCGNDADALDATQEALITVARRLDRYDGRAAFSTWVYRVATNACLDELRRRRRQPDPVDLSGSERTDRVGSAGSDHDDLQTSVVERDALVRALAGLPPDFRTAVVLRDVEDLDYAQIATVLEIPVGTVRSRIARGRAHLARALTGNRGEIPERQSTVSDASLASLSPTDPDRVS